MAGQLQVGGGSAFGAVRYFWELAAREKEERMGGGGGYAGGRDFARGFSFWEVLELQGEYPFSLRGRSVEEERWLVDFWPT